MNKNIKLLLGASSVAMLSICSLQGCGSSTPASSTTSAGATSSSAGAHSAGAASAGAPSAGAPSAGAPSAGAPSAGAPSGGAPSGGSGGASAGAGGASTAGAGGSHAGAGGATAGAGGGGTAGASSAACTTFCSDEMATCTFGPAASAPYASEGACHSACAGFTPGTTGAMSGDTFACRRYHLDAAAANNGALKTTHCPHTGLLSKNNYSDTTATGPCK
jgi:hypothetical protein